eukprot:m.799552 g.799552  ORF g.799552 m.799552 type:complete len:1243 (+) comp23353_c0_seq6:264-3992(+)
MFARTGAGGRVAKRSMPNVKRKRRKPSWSQQQAANKATESHEDLVERMKSGQSTLLVVNRVRPMSNAEILQGAKEVAKVVGEKVVVLLDPNEDADDVLRKNRSREKRYAFDHVFGPDTSQVGVYEKSCKFLLEGVINGYNATVFAYGPTGAGKTFTMSGSASQPGIMPMAIADLFDLMRADTAPVTYKVTVTYIEIYNETIRDLLIPDSPDLDLREDSEGNSIVCGVTRMEISSAERMAKLLRQGNARRTQEATRANLASSRSHAILEVKVEKTSSAADKHTHVQTGTLFMIDLAGSERASTTGNMGARMVEGQHINRSLLALGNCINALHTGNQKYVNFRDSKLTRLLKESLGGNCRTVMIACASPASVHFEETYNTMNYANRAKNIKTKAVQNASVVHAHIAEFGRIIDCLRTEVTFLRAKLHDQQTKTTSMSTDREYSPNHHTSTGKHIDANIASQPSVQVSPGDSDGVAKACITTDPFAVTSNVRLFDDVKRCCDIRIGTEEEISAITQQISDISHSIVRARQHVREPQAASGTRHTSGAHSTVAAENLEELARQRDALVHKASLLQKLSHNQQQATEALVAAGGNASEAATADAWVDRCRDLVAMHALTVENMQLRRQMACSVGQLHWEATTGVADLRDAIIDQQRTLLRDGDVTVPPSLADMYSELESSKEVARVITESIAGNGILSVTPRSLPPSTRVVDDDGTEDDDSSDASPVEMTRNPSVQPVVRQRSNASATRSERVDAVSHTSAKARLVSAISTTSLNKPKRSESSSAAPVDSAVGRSASASEPVIEQTRIRDAPAHPNSSGAPAGAHSSAGSGNDADATEQRILRAMRASVDNGREDPNTASASTEALSSVQSPRPPEPHKSSSRAARAPKAGLGETYTTSGMVGLGGGGNNATGSMLGSAHPKPRRGTYDIEPSSPTLTVSPGPHMQRTFTKARVTSANHWIDSTEGPPTVMEEPKRASPVPDTGDETTAGATTSPRRRLRSTVSTNDATRWMPGDAPTNRETPVSFVTNAANDDATTGTPRRTSAAGVPPPSAPDTLPGLVATTVASEAQRNTSSSATVPTAPGSTIPSASTDNSAGGDTGANEGAPDMRRLTQPAVVAKAPPKRPNGASHVTSSVSAASIYGLNPTGSHRTGVPRADKEKNGSNGQKGGRMSQQAVTPQLSVSGHGKGSGGNGGRTTGGSSSSTKGSHARPKAAPSSALAFGLSTSPYAAAPRQARGVRVKTRPRP